MKRWLIFIALFIIPVHALSHPGKTDRYGAHQCLKGCEEWGLLYGEYHTHDKEGKPVRINVAKRKKLTSKREELHSELMGTFIEADTPKGGQIISARTTTQKHEEIFVCADPRLLSLLALLFFLLLLRVRRRRKGNEAE
jgi:hypothetical protein